MSSYDKCTDRQYLEYGKPYDLRVLEAAGKGWMNTIHCHGDHIMFHILKDYPVQVFNCTPGNPCPPWTRPMPSPASASWAA